MRLSLVFTFKMYESGKIFFQINSVKFTHLFHIALPAHNSQWPYHTVLSFMKKTMH